MALPIGLPWKRELSLRSFEPENPKLFVPRRFGIGWDLNFGAVAAKLGIIRPMIRYRTWRPMFQRDCPLL
ncbi:MAG: DUF5808 domain-containing protein [Corynebacterium camporealensis]|uniref:DUF5808 domain-containing protein n=1 Tax=Corynebacterium camporealensis TaxID=161896 RepID=UPI002A91A643|nr:DUF5808 domain-containing protein [Corynebacterium camporealensis]MDY5839286.1 DUF5808 domain-containing protein [Corynebacterium camporealensis]